MQQSGRNFSNLVLLRDFSYLYVHVKSQDIYISPIWLLLELPLFFMFPHISLQLILKDIDSIVYVDSDILFLQPIDHLWAFLSKFTPSQLAAMAPEHEEPRIAWYSRFARHPFYGRTGVNSGVMLMNMTRIRSVLFKVQMHVFTLATRWRHCTYLAFVCFSVDRMT